MRAPRSWLGPSGDSPSWTRCESWRPEEGISVVHAALAWVLAQEGVSTVIPGAKDPAQAADNAAASGVTLSQVFLDRVRAVA